MNCDKCGAELRLDEYEYWGLSILCLECFENITDES